MHMVYKLLRSVDHSYDAGSSTSPTIFQAPLETWYEHLGHVSFTIVK